MGQPTRALHPRQWRGDEPSHPQERRRAAGLLSARYSAIATGDPEIREPRIYYVEETDSYVITKRSTPESDYPKGKDNIYATYDGTGGIPVAGIAGRILFAWYFNNVNMCSQATSPATAAS